VPAAAVSFPNPAQMKIALISTRLKSATTLTEELLSNSLFVIVSIHE
jgi:hypothetical protein